MKEYIMNFKPPDVELKGLPNSKSYISKPQDFPDFGKFYSTQSTWRERAKPIIFYDTRHITAL